MEKAEAGIGCLDSGQQLVEGTCKVRSEEQWYQ